MKKYSRIVAALLAAVLSISTFVACADNGGNESSSSKTPQSSSSEPATPSADGTDAAPETGGMDAAVMEAAGLEYVDGNFRFIETRDISVEIFDRGLDNGKTAPEDNYWTTFIKEGMLNDHNVNVTFQPVPRWTEADDINNLLASETAPDVCVTYNYPSIQQYAGMGGVIDLAPLLTDYKAAVSNLFGLLTDINIYYDQDPETGELWAVEAFLANNANLNTYIREDWLKTLGLSEPTNLQEFEDCLIAFRDNAETLLGADADKMVPFAMSFDVGWRAYNLLASYIPNDISEKDLFVYGFDDRHFSFPQIKEGVRVLNKWYNEGLIWKDFALYGEGDTTEDTMIKNGYVGAWEQKFDVPYRDGQAGVTYNLQQVAGADANYIAIEPFLNDAGIPKKFLAGTIDRKVFFPSTNDEPVASLLYLDWISKYENRRYLQIGDEGVHHEVRDGGAVALLNATDETIMNSSMNIDYTITINGLLFDDDPAATYASRALAYSDVDPSYVARSMEVSFNEGVVTPVFHFGPIASEEGMATPLKEKRDGLLAKAITCEPAQFDTVWDEGYADYLSTGMQAIIDERTAKWEAKYGTSLVATD
ncbi:MAG: sugar ABC transporter substrate-binding protein [Lachnospiraceae bacterium]|jgi:putative aldouronate transport system substrate-binding protein|nr:sugar ABC transporter substrate-binding protein [Lachnospiraceae bacterium]